jgi:hypothetical protein
VVSGGFDWLAWATDIAARTKGTRRSVTAAEALDNAFTAVDLDPVRLAAESATREASRRVCRAVMLSPSIEVCEALLRGETVPVDRLDPKWVAAFGRRDR